MMIYRSNNNDVAVNINVHSQQQRQHQQRNTIEERGATQSLTRQSLFVPLIRYTNVFDKRSKIIRVAKTSIRDHCYEHNDHRQQVRQGLRRRQQQQHQQHNIATTNSNIVTAVDITTLKINSLFRPFRSLLSTIFLIVIVAVTLKPKNYSQAMIPMVPLVDAATKKSLLINTAATSRNKLQREQQQRDYFKHDSDDDLFNIKDHIPVNVEMELQQEERDLYSYDDTYYSDVHFYSDDDSLYSSSSSSTKSTTALPSNIDWTRYTLKYVSCANIKTWHATTNNDDDTTDTNNNDVLVQHTLVVVRLCPATSCSSYNVKGCNKDFGEYVLPASDYLQIIHTYYINQASIEKYCSVCSACMSYVTNPPTVSPTASPTVTTYDDFYNRHLSNDDYFNDDVYGSSSYRYKPWYLDDNYQCMYQNVCAKYTNKCKKYIENNNDDATTNNNNNAATGGATITNTTFGQCMAFRGDGVSTDYYYYYAAPHCAADGRTLHVGLYADPNCTIYVKSTGSSNPFASYTSGLSCLSCNYYDSSESSYALIPDTAIIQSNINDTSTLSTNHPLCSNLYNASGHCNTRLTSFSPFSNTNLTLSNFTEAEDSIVCPYIESLEDNMYDAYGDVILLKSSMYGLFSPFWRKGNGVASDDDLSTTNTSSKHRTMELCLLFVSMCIFCSLSIHAYTLRKKLLSRNFISWTSTTITNNDENQYQKSIGATNGTIFPCWNDSSNTNYKPPKLDVPHVVRTESGIGITRSYEVPNNSGSYDTETFVPKPKASSSSAITAPYQPYGGAIPKRSNNTNHFPYNHNSNKASVVRFQGDDDTTTINNIPSLEYIDRNTGRFA